MKKWIWFLIGGLVLVLILLAVLRSQGVIGGPNYTQVELDTVKTRTLVETVISNGKLRPETEVKITADVSGEIIALTVKEGQVVKKGDLLARINPDVYQSTLENAAAAVNNSRAQLANARAQLAQQKAIFQQARLEYDRSKKLHKDNVISQSEFEAAEADFKVREAQLEAAEQGVNAAQYSLQGMEARLKEARENLQRTSIYSPIDGTITNLQVEQGERVVGTTQFAGTEMFRVSVLDEMEVRVDVNENDIIRVSKGDTAIIEVDAFPGKKFTGVVTEIGNSAKVEGMNLEQVTNFPVRIRILKDSYRSLIDTANNKTTPFLPGLSAIVEIRTNKVENAVTVPIKAVTLRAPKQGKAASTEGEAEVVFVYENGKAVQKPVKTGIQDDFYIRVIEGLEQGELVISGPYREVSKNLKDGQSVEAKREGKSASGKKFTKGNEEEE